MNIVKAERRIDGGASGQPLTTYYEAKQGKNRYCITSVYKGETDFAKAIESLITKKVLRAISSPTPQTTK